MAKGRDKEQNSSMKKVGVEQPTLVMVDAAEEEEQELWDITHVLLGKDITVTCRMDECSGTAVATWASNLDPNDKWPLCEECQLKDFGGWPENVNPNVANDNDNTESIKATSPPDAAKKPINESSVHDLNVDKSLGLGDKESSMESEESSMDNTEEADGKDANDAAADSSEANATDRDKDLNIPSPETSTIATSETLSMQVDGVVTQSSPMPDTVDDEEEEMWDLRKILKLTEIKRGVKCSTDECSLLACSIWVSSKDPTTKWYTCIDCQANDFGGWPPIEELPVKALSHDHAKGLIVKCSKKKSPPMPPLDESLSPSKLNNGGTNTVTPPPNSTKGFSKPVQQPSAAALKKHREWQQAAEQLNGPDARIVVSKKEAKPLIFDLLYDSFRPMNMTQMYSELKAIVPSPILRSALDDMQEKQENPFDSDSDDDDEKPKAASKKNTPASADPYAGSVAFKSGRNHNTCLYYIDHTKQKNNGNGLEPHQRNELAGNLSQVQGEEVALKATLQKITAETTKLFSEPLNEEATKDLEVQEVEMNDLRDQLEAARKLKVSEKHKKATKKRITTFAGHWRKRKQLCMDFLIQLEEVTEGSITMRKILSGDGPIDVDSDEACTRNAIAYAKHKRSRSGPPKKKMKVVKGLGSKAQSDEGKGGLTADENFVSVQLSSQGLVSRVYLDDGDEQTR